MQLHTYTHQVLTRCSCTCFGRPRMIFTCRYTSVVVQLVGLVDYTSLKKSIWWRRLFSRRPLNAFTDVASTSSWDRLFQRLMTRWEKNWRRASQWQWFFNSFQLWPLVTLFSDLTRCSCTCFGRPRIIFTCRVCIPGLPFPRRPGIPVIFHFRIPGNGTTSFPWKTEAVQLRPRILCGMRNGDHVYFAEYLMRKKHEEFGIICGIKMRKSHVTAY